MKNLILFFSIILFTIACDKNDEPTSNFQEQIMGEWQINSFVINSCPDPENNLAFTVSDDEGCLDVMGQTTCVSILFSENGKATFRDSQISGADGVLTMTYELDECTSTIKICGDGQDCQTFSLREDGLYNEMDESGCICTFGYKKM